MDVVLVPGMWLDGSTWEAVSERIMAAGHRAVELTLPGMGAPGPGPAEVGWADLVGAIVAAIDASPGDKVAVVGHSAGCGLVHAAVDARPDRVLRALYVGGFPTGDGEPMVDGFEVIGGQVPLPEWSEFPPEDLRDLDEGQLADFRQRAFPAPGCLVDDRQKLSDERRYQVPVTMVATEFTTAMLQEWVQGGLQPVSELDSTEHVEYVDLPTGHWPQFTRPVDLAQVIIERLPAPST